MFWRCAAVFSVTALIFFAILEEKGTPLLIPAVVFIASVPMAIWESGKAKKVQ
jgi:hypothetical protein